MIQRTLTPLYLLENYGKKALYIFYPDYCPEKEIITYRKVIDLYNTCLEYKDIRALQRLDELYDLESLMDFDNTFHCEVPVNSKYTEYEWILLRLRQRDREENKPHRTGGRSYRKLFKKQKDGEVVFSARKCIYNMAASDVDTLLKMSDSSCDIDLETASTVDKFEALRALTDRDNLLLFYLRYMCNQRFPVEDWEDLKDGTIKIVDHF